MNNAMPSLRPVGLLVALTLIAWLAGVLWPNLLLALGIHDHRTPYLDSYAVLAALDAMRAGMDPHGTNPLDVLQRSHVYSDWWLALRWLGLTREHNYLVGTVWVGAFALTAWATLWPRRFTESLWLTTLLVSPPVLLAVKRANNDLVIFVLLAGCGLVATANTWWRQFVAISCLALATGLKYFPATGALALLWVRPVRRMPALLLATLLAVGLALASVWGEIERSRFVMFSTVHTMGAPLWWREFGWPDAEAVIPGVLMVLVVAVAFALGRLTTGLATGDRPAESLRAALGAIVILTCFFAGVNYAYRWIFILWPALWLWRQASAASLPDRQRWAATFACLLIALCLWHDGLFCLTVNLRPPQQLAWLDGAQKSFRQWTQPLDWLLMMLLAGWLLEGALTIAREWWAERHAR